MVLNQIQLLQVELGQHLSEELALSSTSKDKLQVLQSEPRRFLALGLVNISDRNLEVEKFFSDPEKKNLDLEFIQTQLGLVSSSSSLQAGQAFFWIDEGANNTKYLFSLLPFEFENKNTWGLGISRVPTPWLEFPGAKSLFLLEKGTGQIISAYGGENQGAGAGEELLQESSYQVASYEISSGESRAWQELRGTNLIVMLKESATSPFVTVGPWAFLSLAFLLGLVLMMSKDEQIQEEEKEEQPEREDLRLRKEAVEPEEPPKSEILEEIEAIPEPKEPKAKPTTAAPIESVIEDQLLESVLTKGEQGHRVVDGISDVLTGLSQEIQAHSIRVNILVPESLTSDWPQTQLKTVLEEVVRNSIEAMEDSEVKTLTFSSEERDSFIDLTVEDTGVGMTDEVLERSLEAFFSTKPSLNKRRGLGLNVAKRLLEISGGKIQIESTPSVGTKVTLSFLRQSQESLLQEQV